MPSQQEIVTLIESLRSDGNAETIAKALTQADFIFGLWDDKAGKILPLTDFARQIEVNQIGIEFVQEQEKEANGVKYFDVTLGLEFETSEPENRFEDFAVYYGDGVGDLTEADGKSVIEIGDFREFNCFAIE